jgi:hypothetical protein
MPRDAAGSGKARRADAMKEERRGGRDGDERRRIGVGAAARLEHWERSGIDRAEGLHLDLARWRQGKVNCTLWIGVVGPCVRLFAHIRLFSLRGTRVGAEPCTPHGDMTASCDF